MGTDRLGRAFFIRPTEVVAEELIGCSVFRRTDDGLVGGVIVETEAYGGAEDAASHAAIYPRSRASVMASAPGTVYVYRSYGIHCCLNIVSKPLDSVGAVLLRAVEPTTGLELMRARRPGRADRDLCRGPGRVCRALGITLADAMIDVVAHGDLWIEPSEKTLCVSATPRVGITRAVDVPWRFAAAGSPFVSAMRTVPA